MEKGGFVYIMASRRNGTIYIGVTSDLTGRIYEHREGTREGFTKRYRVGSLVWFERHSNIDVAIGRKKALKNWHRAWKICLIEEANPHWSDLATEFGFKALAVRP